MPDQENIQAPSEEKVSVDEILAELDPEGKLSKAELKELREEAEMLAEIANEEATRLKMALSKLGSDLEKKFTDYASKRQQKEIEWISAMMQYEGPNRYASLKDYITGEVKEQLEHQIKLNITRPRVRAAIDKMRDIQFPLGGNHNFFLKSEPKLPLEENIANQTPVEGPPTPPTPPGQEPAPQPPQQTVGEIATSRLVEEQNKARRMELEIKTQLDKCDYGKKARDGMWDWAVLGTAIIKGPIVKQYPNKKYKHTQDSTGASVSELQTEFVEMPSAERVDPRLFWPDPNALCIEDAEDAFEGHPCSSTELRKLAKNPAFMAENISQVLGRGPDGNTEQASEALRALMDSDTDLKNRYMVKEYRGIIPKDVLRMMDKISEEEEENNLLEFYGEVWVVQGVVIRLSLSPIEGDNELPYRVVVWDKDPGSMFGHGMCYMMKDQATVAKATWQMLLDNSGLSAGPQIVLNKEGIEPANKKWEIEPMKLWYATEYMEDVRKAFQFVDIPNNQQALSNVIDAALQFADMESSSPMIQGNGQPTAHVPAMNMAMTLSEANVHQRELSQAWDDCITEPLITAWIHYNIQYSDDPSIKGDFHVEVGGATERIDNQILAQDIERILSTSASNPEYALQIDEQAAFRRWVGATRAGNAMLRSPEQVEKKRQELQQMQAEAPPDPDTIRAHAVQMQEETRRAQQQLDAQFKEREIKFKEAEARAELQIKQMELQIAAQDRAAKLQEAQMNMQMEAMRLAAAQQMKLEDVLAKLEMKEMEVDVRREMKAADMYQFEETKALKEEYGTGVSV